MTGKGSNGLAPRDMLATREKCPEAPTKRKFHSLVEAEKAAAFSSQQYHKTVVPYACAGCGLWHITGKTRGSDVARSHPSGIIQTAAMQQRANLATVTPPVERKDMSVVEAMEKPVVAGNREARLKMLSAYLEGRDTATIPEAMEVIGVARKAATDAMHELGWQGRRSRAEWYPPGAAVPPLTPKKGAKPTSRVGRKRALTTYLRNHPRVTGPEIQDVLGVGKDMARTLLQEAGCELYGRGPGAYWTKPVTAEPTTTAVSVSAGAVPAPPVPAPIELAAHRHPSQLMTDPNTGWRTIETTDRLSGQTVAMMNDTLHPFGFEVRLQIREIP